MNRTFGSLPDLWTFGLWCRERPWTWSAGLQPTTVRLECPNDGRIFTYPIDEIGLWPTERCAVCASPEADHRVIDVTIEDLTASPFCLLEETLLVPSLFKSQNERWKSLYHRWFPGPGGALNPATVARKCAVAVAAILTHRARATTARPIVQRMLALPRAELGANAIRRLVRPLGLVTERTERITGALFEYEMMHTPMSDPGPRRIGETIGPYAEAAVRVIVLGQTVETDDPHLSRYVEWLKGHKKCSF